MVSCHPRRTLAGLAGVHKALCVSFLYVPPKRPFTTLRQAPILPAKRSSWSIGSLFAAVFSMFQLDSPRDNATNQSAHGDSTVHDRGQALSQPKLSLEDINRQLEAAFYVVARIEDPPCEDLVQKRVPKWILKEPPSGFTTFLPVRFIELAMTSDPAANPKIIGYSFEIPPDLDYNRDMALLYFMGAMIHKDKEGELAVPGRGACASRWRDEVIVWAYKGGVMREVWKFRVGADRALITEE